MPEIIHLERATLLNCQNPNSRGVCVGIRCNKCRRFSKYQRGTPEWHLRLMQQHLSGIIIALQITVPYKLCMLVLRARWRSYYWHLSRWRNKFRNGKN